MQKYSKVNIITELPQITLKVLQVYNIIWYTVFAIFSSFVKHIRL